MNVNILYMRYEGIGIIRELGSKRKGREKKEKKIQLKMTTEDFLFYVQHQNNNYTVSQSNSSRSYHPHSP